jgi:hypothetical protein
MGSTGSTKAPCWMAFFHFLQELGVMAMLQKTHGAGIGRVMVPFVQYLLLYGLKTLFGIESINALPPLLFADRR